MKTISNNWEANAFKYSTNTAKQWDINFMKTGTPTKTPYVPVILPFLKNSIKTGGKLLKGFGFVAMKTAKNIKNPFQREKKSWLDTCYTKVGTFRESRMIVSFLCLYMHFIGFTVHGFFDSFISIDAILCFSLIFLSVKWLITDVKYFVKHKIIPFS